MKKRLISLLVMLALLLSVSVMACAEREQFVFDSAKLLSGEDLETLNALGARINADTGVAVCVCLSADTGENIAGFARQFYDETIGEAEGIVLVHNPAENQISYAISGERIPALGEDALTQIIDAYNSAQSYSYGVHDFMNLLYARLNGVTAVGTVTPEDNPAIQAERRYDRVADLAGVIEAETLASLNEMADRVSESYACDVAVAFVPSLDGRDIVDYADDFYDHNGYGYGENDDGILLLVSVGEREFAETTYGYGKTAFSDYGMQSYLEPNFTRYLSRNDWAGAARQFITDAGELLRQARAGTPYDSYGSAAPVSERSTGEKVGFAAVISAVIGFFSGAIPTGSMKRSMKSVEKNYGAANYEVSALRLQRNEDRFLYSNVSRTPIPTESDRPGGRSGGGGSSVHFSSSGRSHGGSHGKF